MCPDIKFHAIVLILAFAVLGACAPVQGVFDGTSGKQQRAEKRLPDPQGAQVPPDDPMARHLWARKQVDPTHPETTVNYTARAMSGQEREEAHTLLTAAMKHKPGTETRVAAAVPGSAGRDVEFLPPAQTRLDIEGPPVRTAAVTPAAKPPQFRNVAPPVPGVPWAADTLQTNSTARADIVDVRIGNHPGKTRIVLDLDTPTRFSQSLDNAGRLLLIRIPEGQWEPARDRVFQNHTLLESYIVKVVEGQGTILALRLKRSAKVVWAAALPPATAGGHDRLVFDIAPL